MTQATTTCLEGITSATLAAWREGALSTMEAERVAAHVPECPGCRAEIAAYDAVDAALQGLRAPEPDGRLWQGVRAGMSGGGGRRPTRGRAPQLASGIGAVAAVVLLALGFAQVLQYHAAPSVRTSATATPQGTPTPIPTAIAPAPAVNGPRPNWQQARLPAPLTNTAFLPFAIAPSDGESAYACTVVSDDSGGTVTFYRTTDRALHWTALTHVPVKQSSVSIKCYVETDALDANLVQGWVFVQSMQTNKGFGWSELSEDGGATWTRLDTSDTFNRFSTLNGKTYALRRKDGAPQYLAVSVDHLQTWESVSPALTEPNQGVSNFWLSPDGTLLADVMIESNLPTPGAVIQGPQDMPVYHHTLWQSSDGGAHWTSFPMPTVSGSDVYMFVVGQPVAGQPWQICALYQPQDRGSVASLVCTFDGGQTWSARPQLCTTAPCLPSQVRMSYIDGYTLASDGAVLVTALAPGSTNQNGLYRLPRGSTTWQYLGKMLGGYVYIYAPTSHGGILWSYTGGTYVNRFDGYEALPGLFATATYP